MKLGFKVSINLEIDDDDVLSVLIAALNGGSIRWIKSAPSPEEAMDLLNERKDVIIETDDGKELHLSKGDMYAGMLDYVESGLFKALTENDQDEIVFDTEHLYEDGADFILQHALFREVKY